MSTLIAKDQIDEVEPVDAPPPSRRADIPDPVITAALAVMLVVLAEVAARNGWVSSLILPAPSAVGRTLYAGFSEGVYWRHIASTLSATLIGFVGASTAAIIIAGVITALPRLQATIFPFIIAFQTLPKIAVAPLIILWLGFDQLGKVFIVAIVCFFPVLINTMQGLKVRDRAYLELMRSLGATRWQMFRLIRFPGAIPYIFAGLHIGVIFALIGAVVAEFVGSRAGLGYILLTAKSQFNVPGVFAILFLLMLLGLIFNGAMKLAERRVAAWARDVSEAAH